VNEQQITTEEPTQAAVREQLERIIDLYNRIKYARNGDSAPARRQLRALIDSLQL